MGQPGLHKEFQDSQGYIERSCLEKKNLYHDQVGFIAEVQIVQFIKSINIIHYTNRFKDRNSITISIQMQKDSWQNSKSLYIDKDEKARIMKSMTHYSKINM